MFVSFEKTGQRRIQKTITTRARLELHVVSTMSANDCAVVLGETDAKVSSLSESRKVRTQFGRKMKCIAKIIT